MARLATLSAPLLMLAACTTVEAPDSDPYEPPAEGTCGAGELQDLVGQPRSTLEGMSFPASTRFIGPNTAVTMEFNAERLNIRYNERGIIAEVYCG